MKRHSIDVVAALTSPELLTRMLSEIQLQRKVEPQPKTEDKPKFRAAVHPRRAAGPGEVRKISTQDKFIALCEKAKIPSTRRQASKFLQKRGKAYEQHYRLYGW